MFGGLEDGSWFTWKMHQFTLAKHTLAARSFGVVKLPGDIHARETRLRNAVNDQRRAVVHKHTYIHTYIHVLSLRARDQWRPFHHSCGRRRVTRVTAVSFKV